jgi:hypothetical protein
MSTTNAPVPPAADTLPAAIRVYPEPKETAEEAEPSVKNQNRPYEIPTMPEALFVFDTETRTTTDQRLTFGSARFLVDGRCQEEMLFYADDLPDEDRLILEEYVANHSSAAVDSRSLLLLSRSEFLKKFYAVAYKSRVPVVGVNLPFDISRLGFDVDGARGMYAGGFSLSIWNWKDGFDPNQYRPPISILHIDSKRALIGFRSRKKPDWVDLIPEGSKDGKSDEHYIFTGYWIDLRTLGYALTAKAGSLESMCEAFGVPYRKLPVKQHGVITEAYIDYNRNDVWMTAELAKAMLAEYERHQLDGHPSKVFSIASIGKAYLRKMGIKPVLGRQPTFPKKILGHAQSGFYGGRASAHVRKVPVPVVFLDFLSMYTTVNSLMGLWNFVKAREIKVVEHCRQEIEDFLRQLTLDTFFDPETWKRMPAFVRIIPNGDILPLRSKYGSGQSWNIGVNYIYGDMNKPDDALWYSLPDVAFSVLKTGKIPQIVDAFRIEPVGVQQGLTKVKLRGEIGVDPEGQDFFRVVVEERMRPHPENKKVDAFLKILANSSSYGIYAQMDRREQEHEIDVTCYGIDAESYQCQVDHPEDRGEYFFSPMASLITGGARLMLGLLEYCVSELGGTYAMEDTDSMAIVATESGGLVSCPNNRDENATVEALSWEEVETIRQRFAALNPYDRDLVRGSILRLEDDNLDPATGDQRQIYCYAISAKRYCLFVLDDNGNPILLQKGSNNKKDHWSQHGLGHLLNPNDPDSDDRNWIGKVWLNIIRKALGLPVENLPFENSPAISCFAVSAPNLMQRFAHLNQGKKYPDMYKPFNFMLAAHVEHFGLPIGADPKRFQLVGPYDPDPHNWARMAWIDRHTGDAYRVTVEDDENAHLHGGPVLVKTYGSVIEEYENHPEPKCAGADGKPCSQRTTGLLQRRHVRIGKIVPIGKESNKLEEALAGLIHDERDVIAEYPDPKRSEWLTETVPILNTIPTSELEKETGLSRSAVKDIKAGRSIPHRKNREKLISISQCWNQSNRGEPAKPRAKLKSKSTCRSLKS